MGQEAETEERRDAFAGYQVNEALLARAGPAAVAMHCLPAHRGEEITSEVMDGPRSLIFDQSENRLHVQKALLVELLGGTAARVVINDLFERYKQALRRGHVAASRGQLDEAVVAYREAIELAPDRVLPYTGLSGVLVRLDRPAEALAVLERATDRAPADESAWRARADLLIAANRRGRCRRCAGPAGGHPRRPGSPVRCLRRDPRGPRPRRVARAAAWPRGLRQATGRRSGRRPPRAPSWVEPRRRCASPDRARRAWPTCPRSADLLAATEQAMTAGDAARRPDDRPGGLGGPAPRRPARCRPRHLLPGAAVSRPPIRPSTSP